MIPVFEAAKLEPRRQLSDLATALRLFGVRGWVFALVGALIALLAIGLVASLIENPIFERKLAARDQDYVIWIVASAIAGLIVGTFALTPEGGQGKAVSGGLLSAIAVGCPVCNQVAVTLLGTSGAISVFGPSQLYIGLFSIALLSWTLLLRAGAVVGACPTGSDDISAVPAWPSRTI